ncbi:MAG: AAA family ATPase [Pyrinomonadaceae bacterium]
MTKNNLATGVRSNGGQHGASTLPTYFLSLKVENVRCFGREQTLDLSDGKGRPRQWAIILGDNGVGKTTLLRVLAALTPWPYSYFTSTGEGVRSSVPRYSEDHSMKAEWGLKRHGNNAASCISADYFINTKLTNNKRGEEVMNFSIEEYPFGDTQIWSVMSSKRLREFACFGYGASRRMGKISLSEKAEDNPFASLFYDDVPLLNAEEWLLQADYAARAGSNEATRKRAAKRRDEIKEVLLRILPEVDDIKFAPITEEQTKPGVEVKTPYGWVSIKDLSLGYKTLIAWMVDFASRMFDRYPDSANPLAEPAVVLVDEIDLHLHPKWQRTLMSYLSERFPNTQFIATAHSPLVVQAAADANVVLLRREGDHVVIDNDVKDIHGWRVDQILTSDLFGLESARPPQLDNLLAERAKILAKSRLTKKDRARLKEIESEIGALPTGETPEDMEAMDIIRRAASHLKAQGR